MTRLFARTLREEPADAGTTGLRLLIRAGYLRRVGSGGYGWLPLGRLLLDRVTGVLRAGLGDQPVTVPPEDLATLVRDVCPSYRNYPQTLVGPDATHAYDLTDPYPALRAAHAEILDRLGLGYRAVSTVDGVAYLAQPGDHPYASCPACGYAATLDALTTPPPAPVSTVAGPIEVVDTPDTPTVDSLVDALRAGRVGGRVDWTAADVLKNVVLLVDGEPLVIGVPGDRDVDLDRVRAALHPAPVTVFDDFAARPDLVRGYLGPQGDWKARYLVDPRVVPGSAWATGANEPGRHAVNVVCGRDFTPDGVIEAATVRAGDQCPTCGAPLDLDRGAEVARVRGLGAAGFDALGRDGRAVPVFAASATVDPPALVTALAERHHDDRGLLWPALIAPVQVHLVAIGAPEPAVELADRLTAAGVRVLVDDRPGLSAGVKFADAELLGAPLVLVAGRRLAEGYVELRDRASGTREDVPLTGLPGVLAARLG